MINILVINAGSSSLKYQLFNMEDESILAKGIAERIGAEGSVLKYKGVRGNTEVKAPMKSHVQAIEMVLQALVNPEYGVIKSMDEIAAVGHRVLHGGATFSGSIVIDESVMQAIRDNIPLGPLHNPANLMGIEACQKVMPATPMVAVFDTAFHQTMPPKAFMYGIPYEDYETYKIRRYGFHGTSHRFVAAKVPELVGRPAGELKTIVCHLGNGSSISAVKYGKCVDTSMGLTPLEGVIMGTRCGSIDPAIVPFLMEKKGLSAAEMDTYMNKKSGVLGLSGISSDFRDLGAYAAAMNGVDVIAFTAGVGENDHVVRRLVMEDMEYLGVDFDFERNDNFKRGVNLELSKPGSKVKVWIVPTNEELVIATDTYELTKEIR